MKPLSNARPGFMAITMATLVPMVLAGMGCKDGGSWIVGKYRSNHVGVEVEWELKSNGNFYSTIVGGKNFLGGAIERQPPSMGTWKLNGDILFINSSDNFSKENLVTQTDDGFDLRTGGSGLMLHFKRVHQDVVGQVQNTDDTHDGRPAGDSNELSSNPAGVRPAGVYDRPSNNRRPVRPSGDSGRQPPTRNDGSVPRPVLLVPEF